MRTEGKISPVIAIDADNRHYLTIPNFGDLCCLCGPDAADNAEFIRTAWNEWEEREQMTKGLLEALRPFAGFACDDDWETCACLNCTAKRAVVIADKILNPSPHAEVKP